MNLFKKFMNGNKQEVLFNDGELKRKLTDAEFMEELGKMEGLKVVNNNAYPYGRNIKEDVEAFIIDGKIDFWKHITPTPSELNKEGQEMLLIICDAMGKSADEEEEIAVVIVAKMMDDLVGSLGTSEEYFEDAQMLQDAMVKTMKEEKAMNLKKEMEELQEQLEEVEKDCDECDKTDCKNHPSNKEQ